MLIGVDFDNTVACYDGIFHRAGRERNLIPESVGRSKAEVRDHLRRAGREDDWTALQGYVYGARMDLAAPYPGVREALRAWLARGVDVRVVSHRTRRPYLGPDYDLHAAARRWLADRGFLDPAVVGLAPEAVHLEPTKEAKLARIADLGCTHFVDDLPEFLDEPAFPAGVRGILFDPAGAYAERTDRERYCSWPEIARALTPEAAAAGPGAGC